MVDPAGSTSRGSNMVGHGIFDLSAWTKVDPNMWADVVYGGSIHPYSTWLNVVKTMS